MPSKSAAQHRYMAMCASPSGRANAKGKCPPMKVAREFMIADRGKTLKRSGRIYDGGKKFK